MVMPGNAATTVSMKMATAMRLGERMRICGTLRSGEETISREGDRATANGRLY
jgi:hypothetical protein